MQTSVLCLFKKRLSIWHSGRNRYFFAGCSKLGLAHLELVEQLTAPARLNSTTGLLPALSLAEGFISIKCMP
jgi:hypothetical protein